MVPPTTSIRDRSTRRAGPKPRSWWSASVRHVSVTGEYAAAPATNCRSASSPPTTKASDPVHTTEGYWEMPRGSASDAPATSAPPQASTSAEQCRCGRGRRAASDVATTVSSGVPATDGASARLAQMATAPTEMRATDAISTGATTPAHARAGSVRHGDHGVDARDGQRVDGTQLLAQSRFDRLVHICSRVPEVGAKLLNARDNCDFTVPTLVPITSAICALTDRGRPSTQPRRVVWWAVASPPATCGHVGRRRLGVRRRTSIRTRRDRDQPQRPSPPPMAGQVHHDRRMYAGSR